MPPRSRRKDGFAAHTLVARQGEDQFHPASADSALATLFRPANAGAGKTRLLPGRRRRRASSFGRSEDDKAGNAPIMSSSPT